MHLHAYDSCIIKQPATVVDPALALYICICTAKCDIKQYIMCIFWWNSIACKILSGSMCLHTDVIKQFDTMVFPEVKDKSNIVKQTATFFWGLITGSESESDHPKFYVPPPEDMRKICMEIHLEPYKNGMFSGVFEEGFDVHRSVQDFTALYQCCLIQYCGKETHSVNKWRISRVPNVSILNCTEIRDVILMYYINVIV